jgi:N-acetylglucosamine-6-phosphate deacetylase
MQRAFINGKIFTGHSVETNKAILVDAETIVDIVEESAVPAQFKAQDLKGQNIAPSFIDLQIYGASNRLFSAELTLESLHATYEYCLKGGCAHFMITMATNVSQKYKVAIDRIRTYWDQGGKGLLGLHLEGPYINPSKRGAHLASCIETPTVRDVKELLEKGEGVIKMMTLAPEQCDDAVIELFMKNNILLSAGHSDATYDQATKAFDRGIPLATHIYNAMSGLHHREAGMVGAIFSHPTVMCSLVCDGIHVSYPAIRIAKQMMQERLFLITDAVTESQSEYTHILKGDRYTLPEGTLSGSALTMMQCVKNIVRHADVSLEEALRMASTYPAKMVKGYKLGKIEKGYEASFVVFDDTLKMRKVYC